MSDDNSLEEIKSLINNFEKFLSDDNSKVINQIFNEIDNSASDQQRLEELISRLAGQNNIDLSDL
ncbi:MAG: hypothetical protein ACQEQI_01470 [Bacillota bacterium]